MKKATLELYAESVAALKKRRSCTLCNNFSDADALQGLLEQKECFLHITDSALFLLVPCHNSFYDCLYLAADTASLEQGIKSLLACYDKPLALRTSIIGKGPSVGKVAALFSQYGFTLVKQLLRTAIAACPKNTEAAIAALRSDALASHVSFAEENDVEAILELLLEYFDTCGDNIPERSMILDDIQKKHIIVLKLDNTVAGLHYYRMYNGRYHGLFDVTRKIYRNKFLIFTIINYLAAHWSKNNITVSVVMDGAMLTIKKMIKRFSQGNIFPDGIVIYNMLRHGNKEAAKSSSRRQEQQGNRDMAREVCT